MSKVVSLSDLPDLVAPGQVGVGDVGADEPCPAGDKYPHVDEAQD